MSIWFFGKVLTAGILQIDAGESNLKYLKLIKIVFIALISQILMVEALHASSCEHSFYRPNYISRSAICAIGELVPDQYDGGKLIPCEQMEIDHLISLKEAFDSGVCGLELKRLAQDPDNLRTTFWLTNRKKGRMSPIEFSKNLSGTSKVKFLDDAEVVYKKYKIASKRNLIDLKLRKLSAKGAVRVISFKKFTKKYAKKLTKKVVAKKTLYYVGGKLVAVGAIAGGAVMVYEGSDWAYTNLFLPKDTISSEKRGKVMKEFFKSLDR